MRGLGRKNCFFIHSAKNGLKVRLSGAKVPYLPIQAHLGVEITSAGAV